jgi:hypothetical protein
MRTDASVEEVTMCSSSPSIDSSVPRCSLHEESAREADVHKWIASEKAGYDLGLEAIKDWVRRHWNGYLREKWLEHLQGTRYWIELDLADFGLLQREFRDSAYIGSIVEQLKARGENLSIIRWAHRESLPINEILAILHVLNINSKRIECKLIENLTSPNG